MGAGGGSSGQRAQALGGGGEGGTEEIDGAHPRAARTSRGADAVLTHQPPNLGQLPPNSWQATAGLGWESRGAHGVGGGRPWDRGDPRPRGLCPCRVPSGQQRPPGSPSSTAPEPGGGGCASANTDAPSDKSQHRTSRWGGRGSGGRRPQGQGAAPTVVQGPGQGGHLPAGPGPPPPGDRGAPSESDPRGLHTRQGPGYPACRDRELPAGQPRAGRGRGTPPWDTAQGRKGKAQREHQAEVRQGGLQGECERQRKGPEPAGGAGCRVTPGLAPTQSVRRGTEPGFLPRAVPYVALSLPSLCSPGQADGRMSPALFRVCWGWGLGGFQAARPTPTHSARRGVCLPGGSLLLSPLLFLPCPSPSCDCPRPQSPPHVHNMGTPDPGAAPGAESGTVG